MEENTEALVAAQLAAALITANPARVNADMDLSAAQAAARIYYGVVTALRERRTTSQGFVEISE